MVGWEESSLGRGGGLKEIVMDMYEWSVRAGVGSVLKSDIAGVS